MKKWYVYEIVNLMGTIEHIGETQNTKQRFKNHKAKKFKGRCDLTYNIVKEFSSKDEAYTFQCELQKEYGLKTDIEVLKENISKANKVINTPKRILHNENIRNIQNFSKIVCPHCNKKGQARAMKRWHFDNCKHNIVK